MDGPPLVRFSSLQNLHHCRFSSLTSINGATRPSNGPVVGFTVRDSGALRASGTERAADGMKATNDGVWLSEERSGHGSDQTGDCNAGGVNSPRNIDRSVADTTIDDCIK